MKRTSRSAVGILAAIAVIAMSCGLTAAEIKVVYHFEKPLIEALDSGFSRIIFPATIQAGRAGEPTYPFRGVRVLLPPGETVVNVQVERKGWTLIGGKHKLYPRQHPVPGIDKDGSGALLLNNSAYEIDRWVHPPVSEFRTRYLRGHAIASGTFSPAGFLPKTGKVGYYKAVTITLATAPGDDSRRALDLLRTDTETRNRLSRIVANPGDLSLYDHERPRLGSSADDYEYLIITQDSLESCFAPLADFYTRRGIRAKIMTTGFIDLNFTGSDPAERVRAAITFEYTGHGITHVLLGGDGDGPPGTAKIVPYRGLYCTVQSSSVYEDENIPADLYFAALDGDWNGDGDGLWGEPGEEDFYSEISVGRACVDSGEEIANFINKTIMYQDNPIEGQLRDTSMFGEYLYGDPLTYGGDELDQLIGACTAYGFTTTGIPPDHNITKYYDRDLGSWPKSCVFGEVNAGANWINHAGHSSTTYVIRLSSSDINTTNFTNDGTGAIFPIFYSYGCYAGAFDSDDCITETMVSIETCAAAFFSNSRYGWFTEGTTNGPSHHFQREFFDAVFTEGYTTLGAANQRSKDETVPFVDLPDEYEPGAHRWCFYTLNLLGDPALDGWTDTPQDLTVSHDSTIGRDDTLFIVDAGIEGAVASLYRDGICYGRGVANSGGLINMEIAIPFPDTVCAVELNVHAHNHRGYRDTVDVVETTSAGMIIPAIALEQNVPNPFNPTTVIRFYLPATGNVDLRVYDVAGREVERLFMGRKSEGFHELTWSPDHLSSGVYFFMLRAGGTRISRKAVLLR